MKRFLLLWVVLGLAHLVAREGVAIGVFRHIDVRDLAFVQSVAVPGLQAAVLALVTRRRARGGATRTVSLARRPLLLAVLAAAFTVVTLGIALRGRPAFALGGTRGLYAAATAVFALAAAAALASASGRLPRGRAPFALLAAGLVVWAADAFGDFLPRLPDHLLPRANTLLRYVVVLGGLLAGALAVLVAAADVSRARRSAAAPLFEAAAALTVVASLIVVFSYYDHPWIVEPWRTVEKTASFLALAAILLGGLALASDTRAV